MPVKHAPTKKAKEKKPELEDQMDRDEEKDPPVTPKARMPIDFDMADPLFPEDKPESDPLLSEEEDESLGTDDTGLEEELDPFSDKYEE